MSIPRDPNNPGYPVHPGEMLREEFMTPLDLTAVDLAAALHVDTVRINDLFEERGRIDAELAYRLTAYFGMTAGFWMGLQADYDLGRVYYSDLHARIQQEVKPRPREKSLAGAA